MAVTNNLKKQVDLPVFEWMRFCPSASTSISGTTTSELGTDRYIYYLVSSVFYRYDTYADTWELLASPTSTPTTVMSMRYSDRHGFRGKVLSATTNTITVGGIRGRGLDGKNIEIFTGPGDGQVKKATFVSEDIREQGVATSASSTLITDTTRRWKVNQWAGYNVTITFGTGQGQQRRVLYNNENTLYFQDSNLQAFDHRQNMAFSAIAPQATPVATAGLQAHFVISSQTYSVDSDWLVIPTSDSYFGFHSGAIFMMSAWATGSQWLMQYYDVITDTWAYKSAQASLTNTNWGTDIAFERFNKFLRTYITGTVTSATDRTITDTNMIGTENDKYKNYRIFISSGTGMGQSRRIIGHNNTTAWINRKRDVIPDTTSVYTVHGDFQRIFLMGNGQSSMYGYNSEFDIWFQGSEYDIGQAVSGAVTIQGRVPLGISTGTRTANGITAINATPINGGTGYAIGDVLNLTTTGTLGKVIVESIAPGGVVTSVSLHQAGTGYAISTSATSNVTGTGTACTIGITAVGVVILYTTNTNHIIKKGDTVTISGDTGTGHNGLKTIHTVPAINTFEILSTAAASFAQTAQSTTTLIDSTKNWTTNEWAGQMIQLSLAGYQGTSSVRKILSNTSNTITIVGTRTAPVNGSGRYVIHDLSAFGKDDQFKISTRLTDSYATGGSTTTLIDSTKNWTPNSWAGYKFRILSGTGFDQGEITIISNTATTLTYATQTFTPNETTHYDIMDSYGTATAGTTTTLTDSFKNRQVNQWAGKRVKFTGGTGQGIESTITSNTANTLTFSATTAPDTTTTYTIIGCPVKGIGIDPLWLFGTTNTDLVGRTMFCLRGSGSNQFEFYDIPTEKWIYNKAPTPMQESFTTGTMVTYDGEDKIYIQPNSLNKILSYDCASNRSRTVGTLPYGMSTAIVGNRMETIITEDGLKYLYILRHSGTEMWRTLLFF